MLEIIDINKRELSKGLKDKLFDEVKNYDNAFFIFLASTINEKNRIINFISKYIYTKNINSRIFKRLEFRLLPINRQKAHRTLMF